MKAGRRKRWGSSAGPHSRGEPGWLGGKKSWRGSVIKRAQTIHASGQLPQRHKLRATFTSRQEKNHTAHCLCFDIGIYFDIRYLSHRIELNLNVPGTDFRRKDVADSIQSRPRGDSKWNMPPRSDRGRLARSKLTHHPSAYDCHLLQPNSAAKASLHNPDVPKRYLSRIREPATAKATGNPPRHGRSRRAHRIGIPRASRPIPRQPVKQARGPPGDE